MRREKGWTILVTVCMAVALLYSCGGRSRYKFLSFFFDGVPDPDQVTQKVTEKEVIGKKATASYGHGPYAAKLCHGCHERASNALVVPIRELCYRCHELKMDKKYIHGPLASGGCIICHDPHGSRYKFLLVSDAEYFCLYCHDAKAIAANDAHKTAEKNCTSCHDAHMSDKRYLLK